MTKLKLYKTLVFVGFCLLVPVIVTISTILYLYEVAAWHLKKKTVLR